MAKPSARILEAHEIAVGLKSSFESQITCEAVEIFATLSGDHTPLTTQSVESP